MNSADTISVRSSSGAARQEAGERDGNAGFSLLEMVIGLTVLSIALLGLGVLLVANERARENTALEVQATHLLRNVAESIRSVTFADTADQFDNYYFTDTESGATGLVQVFRNEMDTSAAAQILGFPRDLDGDDLADNVSVTNYNLLPVKIEVYFDTLDGTLTRELYLILSDED